ncbi:MAG: met pdase i: methionine aminopeptidase type i [Verrucomicrobiales bacterium]|nr:met pdase i: methionine aminopeptidase type i [Verrucomicrobiales bacterium]
MKRSNGNNGIAIRKGAELDGLRLAGHTAAEVLGKAAALIRPGVSTGEVDAAAAQFMADAGSRSAFLGYRGFSGHICISLNEEVVHGIGRAGRIIQNGDIVKIDVGVIKNGWIGDNATSVPVGAIRPDVHQLLRATEESLHVAISHAVPGGMLRKLCGSVEEFVRRFNFTVVRQFVGHGLGRKLHEKPEVPNFDSGNIKTRLMPGMVLAIEPMVNMGTGEVEVLADGWTAVTRDRRPSSHFEHTVLITEEGPEILTPRARLTQPMEPVPA